MSKKRILMRLGKTPTEPVGAWDTFRRNTIGGNNGNLIFGYASHKLLSSDSTSVEANHYRINERMAGMVNEQYDGFVLPLANAFRPGFKDELIRTTSFIKKLEIPFMMLSGGAQLPENGDPSRLKFMEQEVKNFVGAVLDKSPIIGVRGARTAEYLNSLGFTDVDVIGCPSLTLLSEGHVIVNPDGESDLAVAYNLETSRDLHIDIVHQIEESFQASYFPQDIKTLEMLLWGTRHYIGSSPALPKNLAHDQFVNNKARFHLDAPTWIEDLRSFDFSIGSRIHGNIAALLAGTPAFVLAHDSRTIELCEYHKVPFINISSGESTRLDFKEIVATADYTAFNNNHQKTKRHLLDYVERCGFNHIYQEPSLDALIEYETQVESLIFPDPVRHTTHSAGSKDNTDRSAAVFEQIQVLEKRIRKISAEANDRNVEIRKLQAQNKTLKKENLELKKQTGDLQWTLDRLMKLPRRIKRAFRR